MPSPIHQLRLPLLWLVGLCLLGSVLVACEGAKQTAPVVADAASSDTADAVAAGDGGDAGDVACLCTETTTCCDGCKPKSEGKKCPPAGAVWGICNAGACTAVAGDVGEIGLGEKDGIGSLAYSPDGARLLATVVGVSGTDGRTVLWNTGAKAESWHKPGLARGGIFLPADASVVAIGTDPAQLLAADDGQVLATLVGGAGPVAVSHSGEHIAATTPTSLILFDRGGVAKRTIERAAVDKAQHRALAFSPDDAWLASGTGQQGLGSPHGDVRVFGLGSAGGSFTVNCSNMGLAYAPSSGELLGACWNHVSRWDAAGKLLDLAFDADTVLAVTWSPNGQFVAVGTLSGGVKIFPTAAATLPIAAPLARLPVLQVTALAWAPDGKSLAVGAGNKAIIYLWTLPGSFN